MNVTVRGECRLKTLSKSRKRKRVVETAVKSSAGEQKRNILGRFSNAVVCIIQFPGAESNKTARLRENGFPRLCIFKRMFWLLFSPPKADIIGNLSESLREYGEVKIECAHQNDWVTSRSWWQPVLSREKSCPDCLTKRRNETDKISLRARAFRYLLKKLLYWNDPELGSPWMKHPSPNGYLR